MKQHSALKLPANYRPRLDVRATQDAIEKTRGYFENRLAHALNLTRVSAPLFVEASRGINDDLNGVETPVSFRIGAIGGKRVEIVQSLAKWKRLALHDYGFREGEGLYTDMNAVRKDELLDNLHSIYVDQWDWERVLTCSQRTTRTLKNHAALIYEAVKELEGYLCSLYPCLGTSLPKHLTFVTAQELEDRYPGLTPGQRENVIAREYGAVFIMQIGHRLKSGQKHDGRAPDYDDWTLNGDLLFWYPLLEQAVEISSMGIRVDAEVLDRQLELAGCSERRWFPFHQKVLCGELPPTIGGGIGQSRLCMYVLKKAHIGEVQVGVWPRVMIDACEQANIKLL